MDDERETKAARVLRRLLDGPATLDELAAAGGCTRRHVQQLIAKRGAERLTLYDGEAVRVVFRAWSAHRTDAWLHCRTCGADVELTREQVGVLGLDALAKYSHQADAVRLVGQCARCRRRSGELPPIGA